MYREISKLVMFRNFGEDSILNNLSKIIQEAEAGSADKAELVRRSYGEIRKLLEVGTDYGFDKNLWRDYLTFLLITNENPFTLTCEKVGANDGSVNGFAKSDFGIFLGLMNYDFKPLEEKLGVDCFTTVTNYHSIPKKKNMYNRNVSEKVRDLSDRLAALDPTDCDGAFEILTEFYKRYGVGMFGLNRAFRIRHEEGKELEFIPINNTDRVMLDDLVGYEIQKKRLRDNTEAFVSGRRANNCLLFGDAGTGKSTSIKALINEYYDEGLRMIEIYKHEFKELSAVISAIKNRNYRFIIYMDDLSFEDFEIEYKYLKAVIEGGLESRPENVLIYATSNRRHLIKETWNDSHDMDLEKHHSDTVEEKLSLVARFGVTINFSTPAQKEYFHIVKELAARYPEIDLTEEELLAQANKWEMTHGGMSGRTAQQFIDYLSGMMSIK
ncbi:MAG: ATP-binding protein [Clostridiales bacterium]|nr:ATP-binding protein [Clostridiales bacterium]